MASKHFSLPDKVLHWIEAKAEEKGMRRSQYLVYLLTRIMDEEGAGR